MSTPPQGTYPPRGFVLMLALLCSTSVSACAVVPRYQREALSNPAMDPSGTQLEARSLAKIHDTREGAAGGGGQRSGGGCGCGN